MARLNTKQMVITQLDEAWCHLSMPFNRVFQERLKQEAVGCHWEYTDPYKKHGRWLCPIEMREIAAEMGRQIGYEIHWQLERGGKSKLKGHVRSTAFKHSHQYQREAAERAFFAQYYMYNFEMGLGKTLTAILVMIMKKAKKVLIICPAIVRLSWVDELDRWWEGHPEVEVCDTGKKAEKTLAPIVITSYQLAAKLPKQKWDVIVIDESHYISNRKAQRSKTVRRLLDGNRRFAHILFLSATPITNEPHQLHHQLDSLYPRRYGNFFQFAERYCEIDSNEYTDWWIHGTRNEDELEARLRFVSSRVTKREVEHLLPAFVVTPIRIRPKRSFNPKELVESFLRMDKHNASNGLVEACTDDKIKAALEWSESAQGKLVIATHLRATASTIAEGLNKRPHVFHFDGETPTKKRKAILKAATSTPNAILVCTMHSVKEGINDMVGFDNCLLAELYYTPGVMAQFLGRFHRLNGSCNVAVLCLEGTQDELVAARLREKLANVKKLYEQGVVSGKLDSALTGTETEEEFFEGIRQAASSMVQEDAYL